MNSLPLNFRIAWSVLNSTEISIAVVETISWFLKPRNRKPKHYIMEIVIENQENSNTRGRFYFITCLNTCDMKRDRSLRIDDLSTSNAKFHSQGYLKVTAIVLGPGDEIPVSLLCSCRFVFIMLCEVVGSNPVSAPLPRATPPPQSHMIIGLTHFIWSVSFCAVYLVMVRITTD